MPSKGTPGHNFNHLKSSIKRFLKRNRQTEPRFFFKFRHGDMFRFKDHHQVAITGTLKLCEIGLVCGIPYRVRTEAVLYKIVYKSVKIVGLVMSCQVLCPSCI